ncbi:MAG: putative dithiol-disulfide isomerase involved in polyketide biosynthesis [Rhodospirillales bacterium]|jgi:predicted DsbA family dithiol-disulfide isomerase|nr:putative dithiol-disulfide isomerase involved in polyketide biosynthesis [Rhodospirillales bacterium]
MSDDAVLDNDAGAAEMLPLAGHIDIVSDAICPWCWIGKRHFAGALAILAKDGMRFTQSWRPYQLNPDMPAEGVMREAYRAKKFGSIESSRQKDAQVAEFGRAAGLEFRFDRMTWTPNTVQAHRLLRLAAPTGRQDALAEALFAAYFQEGQDIGDVAVLSAIGRAAGLDAATIAEFEGGVAGRAEVLAEDAAMREAGLNGVPSFVLDRHLLFSGAQPPEQMAASFSRAVRILRERSDGGA